ncbi:uncharacterized protein [Amphiura filiformis]|uniref:uncharacterized protein n=1 Tax=Amphiura filiformis TaxID=82378 RepID=UPI003B212FFF
MVDGGTLSSGPVEVTSQCDRVVLRRFIARPRPRRTTLGFGISQMILGLAIIAVSFTAFALSTSNRVRNACPYWAGFSVLLTGGVGLIAWKQPSSLAISFFTFLSAVCVVLHLVATALSGLSGAELQRLADCKKLPATGICYCCDSLTKCTLTGNGPLDLLPFEGVQDCAMVTSTIKELMYAICVANIVACVVCIAATIIGCAYIVKRHTTRRMVLRRSLNGSLARDSFFTDIMPVDPVFTPPLVPPPPYSPPEYTEISNDPVIMESPEFMDDLSTPTPVIGPNELPPPYSILDFATGRTISVGCAVAQEYQVNSSEGQRPENRRRLNRQRPYSTGNAYITLFQNQNTEGIPQPPLRWDSHQVAVELTQGNQQTTNNTVIIQSGNNRRKNNKRPSSSGSPRQIRDPREILRYITAQEIIGGQTTCLNGTNGNQDPTQNNTHQVEVQTETPPTQCHGTGMRERSASTESGNAHLSRVSTASQTSLEGNSEIVPHPCVNMATNTELGNDNRPFVEDIANANIQGATPRDNHPLSPMTVSRLQIGNIPCAIGSLFETPADIDNVFCNDNHIRVTLGKSPVTHENSPKDRCTPNGTILSPTFATPSDKSHSGSSERLTTGTGSTTTSRSSRGSTSSSGRRHRRHRSNGDRRHRTSTSTCSNSPTDQSSQSSSNGSFGRQRRQARPAPLSSSSSDSEQELRIPPRRMVAKMVNGTVQNVMQDAEFSFCSSSSHRRPPRNRRSSGSSTTNTPPRGRTRQRRPASERNKSPGINLSHNLNSASMQKDTKTSDSNVSNVPPLIPPSNECGEEAVIRRHKRPDSLDLNLNKSWMPRQRRSLVVNISRQLDLEDPWVRRDNWQRAVPPTNTKSKELKVPSTDIITKECSSSQTEIDNKLLDAATCNNSQQTENKNQVHYGNSNGPLHLGTAELYARTHNVLPNERASVSAPVPRAPKHKLKPRPKSMVELTKNTQSLVTKFLDQANTEHMSPAIKTVLQDIQSVINSDESHLAEILQSTSAIDQYVTEKTGESIKSPSEPEVDSNKLVGELDSWTGRNKLYSVISDSDSMKSPDRGNQQGARPKGTNTLRREMVKNLQEAKETIL